jgi:hypothetical protein
MRPFRPLSVVLALLAAAPLFAGVDIDLGGSLRVGDDADIWFSVSSRYFERERPAVERVAARYTDPDDLAVALFISRTARVSPDRVWEMRAGQRSWWEVGARLGVPADAWFVRVDRRPGPPYGKAYGHWKKNRRHPERIHLADVDCRNLVALRMIHEYWGVPVDVAMEWRADGRPLSRIMAAEYARRHGPPPHARGARTAPGHARYDDDRHGHGRVKRSEHDSRGRD